MVTVLFIILAWFLMQSSTFIFSFYMNAAPTEQLGAVGQTFHRLQAQLVPDWITSLHPNR